MATLAMRKVQLADGMVLIGATKRPMALRDGMQMLGDHSSANRRHWRVTASAFAILDQHRNPMVWLEGNLSNVQVVGEMACTVAKPTYAGFRPPGLAGGTAVEQLKWFEVIRDAQGRAILRTWWAQGENINRTCRICRDEYFPARWGARFQRIRELMQLMGLETGE